jgi:hypothetical protein
VDTDRPGEEIPKDYRKVVKYLIDSEGWSYRKPAGNGYPRLVPSDTAQTQQLARRDSPQRRALATGEEVILMDWDWYSIHLEARPHAGALDISVDENAADALMELLEEHDGVVSAGTGVWDVTFSIRAPSAWEAVMQGAPLAEKLAGRAGMPSWPFARADAIRQDMLDAENAKPTLPELVAVPEAAEILGVSPQRVRELSVTNPGFPEPMYELRTGKLWLRDAIDAFARRDRKPGRPPKKRPAAPGPSREALRMRSA